MNRLVARYLLLPMHERIMHRDTFAVAADLERSQWLSLDELLAMQLRKLNSLLAVALRSTQYGKLMGIDPNWRARHLDDIQRLPLMDKAFINAHRNELLNNNVPGGSIASRTGGSTGTPLWFYLDRRRQAFDKAARIRTHRWWNIEPGQREAYIWNSPVEVNRQDKLKTLRDRLTNDFLLPASDLSPRTVAHHLRRLRRFRPDCLFGYPSSMCMLIQLADEAGLDLSQIDPKVIFTTAELLHDHQRATLSRAFSDVPVADGYGSREAGFIAHQCPSGGMHITSENVIVEFLRDGRPAPPAEDAEIVVTQLDNYAMPLIRYRTGDLGQRSEARCPCGRGLQLMNVIKGRSNDLIRTPDGRCIHGSALSAVVAAIDGVRAFQFRQQRLDEIELLLVTSDSFPQNGKQRLARALQSRIGAAMQLNITPCDDIPRLPSGKLQYVVSNLNSAQPTQAQQAPQPEKRSPDA